MDDAEINDIRTQEEFKTVSFSKFQKTKVKKALLKGFSDGKVETACYWSAELVCAGHFVELWEAIIYFVSKHLHIGNPLLPTYITRRIDAFRKIMSNGHVGNELCLRNNNNIRKLFAEIIATLCLSRKHHVFEAVKVTRPDDFNMTQISQKLKAPNISYSKDIFLEGDPTELLVAINEFMYHISVDSKNSFSASYWLEWILEYETGCKQRKENIEIERREWAPVDLKYQKDIIWLVWGAIIKQTEIKKCKITKNIVDSLLGMFTIRFTCGVRKRRRFLIYNAITLLTNTVDYRIPIWSNKQTVASVVNKIDVIYKQIKKNEIPHDINNAMIDVKKTNLDRTIERIEMMNIALDKKRI